jgi:hypothetical protein
VVVRKSERVRKKPQSNRYRGKNEVGNKERKEGWNGMKLQCEREVERVIEIREYYPLS